MKDIVEVELFVKELLTEERYNHSVDVKNKAVELAKLYGEDERIVSLVGIAHDLAKEIPTKEKIQYCEKNNIIIDEIERINPELLHGKIGKDISIKKLGFTEDMGNAIEYHTTGKKGMNNLAKIIFVADSIAEDRNWNGIEEGRKLARKNLDEAVLYFLNKTIEYVLEKKEYIHINSIELRNQYLTK
ncbi:MAG: HD domain-containing protein [Clostridia bacterium]|nr:HD domain-containing protein [Clostridia bacterium]